MKKVLSILIVILMLPVMVNAKTLDFSGKSYGGSSQEVFRAITETPDGGTITVGLMWSSDIPNLSIIGQNEALIVKYNEDGDVVWEKNFGGNSNDWYDSIKTVSTGGYIVVGTTHSRDIDGFEKEDSSPDGIIVRYDEDGNIIWKNIYSSGRWRYDNFYDVIELKDGSFLVAGTADKDDICPSPTEENPYPDCIMDVNDGILIKYDKNGNKIWEKRYGNYEENIFDSLTATSDGGAIVIGETYYEEGTSDNKTIQGWIIKVDSEGEILWEKIWGGNHVEYFDDVVALEDDSAIVVGHTYSTDIEGLSIIGPFDAVIMRVDKNGNILWYKNYGGTRYDVFYGVTITNEGNIVAGGNSDSSYIEGNTTNGDEECIIVKYDTDGNLLWQTSYGGKSSDFMYDIISGKDGRLYGAGMFKPSTIAGVTAKGGYDAMHLTIGIKYDITEIAPENGKYEVKIEGTTAVVEPESEEGYVLSEVIVKDSKGEVVDIVPSCDNKVEFELYDDVTIEVIFKKVYNISVKPTENGKATAEQYEDGKGRVNAVPDEGYELDTIVIKDTTGKEVVYEEKDGYYFFDVNDDLEITVTFKELPKEVVKGDEEEKEENPKTADAFIYYACAVVSSLFGIWSVEQYRKTVKE